MQRVKSAGGWQKFAESGGAQHENKQTSGFEVEHEAIAGFD
jgi:hypothetical protein